MTMYTGVFRTGDKLFRLGSVVYTDLFLGTGVVSEARRVPVLLK